MKTYQAPSTFWLDHEFHVYDHDASWNAASGIYIFAGPQKDWRGALRWRALYIGKADNFSVRLSNHERWQEAKRLGATHVHARVVKGVLQRSIIEEELIKAFQPPLNIQLR